MIIHLKKIVLFGVIFLSGCAPKEVNLSHDQPVAQVEGKKLYVSDLKNSLPGSLSKDDSVRMAREYIEKWIKQQLMVSEAESKLSPEERNVSKELESYRQELLIYKYKNKMMQPVINHSVSDDEVLNYYKKNNDKYILGQPVVKVNYLIFPGEVKIPADIRNILSSTDNDDVDKYEEYVFKYAKKYDSFEDKWIYLDNLLRPLEITISDPENFLKNKKIIEKEIGNEIYIIAVKKYHLPGEQAPVELVAPQIRGAIINREKLDFLREIKDSLYKDALKYNKFKVFNP